VRHKGRFWCILVLTGVIVTLPTMLSQAQETLGWTENHSYSTICAEEDNINVPIFGPEVSCFWVMVTHPVYCPCVYNGCPPDFSGCPPGSGDEGTETYTKLWDDGVNVVKVCNVSDWWRPYSMNVVVNGNSASGHYLQYYRKIEGEDSWPQFLVLYEDGNMRIKPHPPEGIADVCFGSSVIIGPATPATRPYVDIQKVQINPSALSLDITYRNGETAHIDLFVNCSQAVAEVEIGYSTSTGIPFATFRSMWVADGNADVDHIRASTGNFPVLAGWTNLEGLWWSFHREIDSTHNRSAPDVQIAVDTPAVFRVEGPTGNVFADGSFYGASFHSGSADVAEWVPVSEEVEPGDVLELDPENPGHYRKSRGPCSTLVAGVVSTNPGVILGSQVLGSDTGLTTDDSRLVTDDSALLALLGIVPVKVTDEGGPIQAGDLLVVSSTPGHAMRWDADSAGGDSCGLIGKALEALEKGTGVILVLLMR